MAAAKKQCFLRFLGDFCTELSLHRSVIQSPRFTNDYKFGISVNTYQLTCTHDKVKVRIFSRLKNMELNRWPKLLLNALFIVSNQSGRDLSWKWLNSIGNILSDNNLSSMVQCQLRNQ